MLLFQEQTKREAMQNNPKRSRLDRPAIYQIKVQGRLDANWME